LEWVVGCSRRRMQHVYAMELGADVCWGCR